MGCASDTDDSAKALASDAVRSAVGGRGRRDAVRKLRGQRTAMTVISKRERKLQMESVFQILDTVNGIKRNAISQRC